MQLTTKSRFGQILVWLIWLLVLLTTLAGSLGTPVPHAEGALALVPSCPPPSGPLFPWQPRVRWRKWAFQRYQAWQQRLRQARWAYRRAVGIAHGARLLLAGMVPLAAIVDWLTRAQLRRQLGALPVLYAVLEILQVRAIINRHCPPGAAEIDHGTVALVLILNRLTAPRPLYQVAGWLAETSLVTLLGVPAAKFNDDRLRRTLEVLAPHLRAIWLDIVHQALVHLDVDLRVLFYDLTAFIVQGAYAHSRLAKFGFAHNTPMNKRKIKEGLVAAADGRVPVDYGLWAGAAADSATVQQNLGCLHDLLARHGYPPEGVLLIGDRAMLNDELALAYEHKRREGPLYYLAGLEARKKAHRRLLRQYPESYLLRHPLNQEGYYGLPCAIQFQHAGQTVTPRGLLVYSQPMARAHQRTRATQLKALRADLQTVAARIGQRAYRTVAQVQARAKTCLRGSPVGAFVEIWAYEEAGQVRLRWRLKAAELRAIRRGDGRYLLVTNHPHLTPQQMLALYRGKDACEKCFTISKHDLRVSPIYLHQDARIEAMLLLNMLALLTYNVLERQARRHGLALTTRRIIAALENLTVIETHCWDGSVLVKLTPVDPAQAQLLQALAEILETLRWPALSPVLPAAPADLRGGGLSPGPPTRENLALRRPAA